MKFKTLKIKIFLIITLSSLQFVNPEKSLFDELPFNGALDPELEAEAEYRTINPRPSDIRGARSPTPDTKIQSDSEPHHYPQEKTRISLFDEVPHQGAMITSHGQKTRTPRDSVDFDVTRVVPSNEFDVPFWDNRLLSPIINSISRPPPQKMTPVVRVHPYHNSNRLFGHHNPQPPSRNSYGPPPPPPQRRYHHHNNYHGWNPLPTPTSPPQQTQREISDTTVNNKTYHLSANSGGPTVIVYAHPKKETSPGSASFDEPQPQRPTSTEVPIKNEIHYHYHINNKEEQKPRPPQPPYGRQPPPRHHHQHHRPPRPPPPSQGYGPPQPNPNPPPTLAPPNLNGPYPASQHSPSYSGRDGQFNNDLEDDFSRRTFITPSRSHHQSNTYRPADTVSLTQPLSTSYEVPPSLNAPSSTYGAPSSSYGPPSEHNKPSPSYGPPSAAEALPPAPPPADDLIGNDQFETTITLQTIPVTRQVTELVQVPNVVHKISSNRPQAFQQNLDDEGINPSTVVNSPSTAYGPPSHRQKAKPQSKYPKSPSKVKEQNERPFDSHLSQILGVGPTQSSKDTILQELLLNQARLPGYDLTLNDLELLTLLQGSRGGHGGFQSSSLFGGGSRNLFGGGGGLLGNTRSPTNILSSQFGLNLGNQNQGLSSDGLGSFREAFREQRLQIALQDLRKQLRDQNKENVRERSSYRSMFTKGAMLLGALTMLPSIVNPMASAAGVGTAAASTITNYMLPVTAAGRRKRSIRDEKDCFNFNFNGTINNAIKTKGDISTNVAMYRKWLQCAQTHQQLHNKEKDISPFVTALTPCMQKDFCDIMETDDISVKSSLLNIYSILFHDMDKNPWIQQSLLAAKRKRCNTFKCL